MTDHLSTAWYELHIKNQIYCQLCWLLSDLLLSIACDPPFLSFHRHTAATNLHGNPSRSVPWEREWAELTSVWTLARGQCQHTNMAHSILPYGAIVYVLAGPGSRTRPWCELLLRTGHINTRAHLIRELLESDVTARKCEHSFLYSHTCLFPVM